MRGLGDDLGEEVARLREHYDAFYRADDIAHYSPGITRAFLEALLSRGRVPRGARVLDLGCGAGFYSAHLSELGYHVVGIDISETAIARARAAFPRIEFHVADALNLGERFGRFHAVLMMCCSLLNTRSAETFRAVVQKAAEYLEPGGVVLLVVGSNLTGRTVPGSTWINHTSGELRRLADSPGLEARGPYVTQMRLVPILGRFALSPLLSWTLRSAPGRFGRLVVYFIRLRSPEAATRS